jgi:hypothetical protein
MMTQPLKILPIFVTIGCVLGQPDIGDDNDTDDQCGNAVIFPTWPAEGSEDAYYRTTIEVTFKAAASDASIELRDASDNLVDGEWAWVNNTIVFEPVGPLQPLTEYTYTVVYECGEPLVASFTTSEVGSEVTCEANQALTFDIMYARYTSPAGLAPLFSQQLRSNLLLQFSATTPEREEISVDAAFSQPKDDEVQDLCQESVDVVNPATLANPDFSFQASPFTVPTEQGYYIRVEEPEFSGSLGPDCQTIEGGRIQGMADTRQGSEDVCSFATSFGEQCVACPSDGLEFCLWVVADSIKGHVVPDLALVKRSAEDIEADPECD